MTTAKRARPWLRALSIIIIGLLLAVSIYAYRYVNSAASPREAALTTMALPTVTTVDGVITFAPTGTARDVGVIFYQGGLVEAPAYAPVAYDLAAAGYSVFIPEMPFNLAVFRPNLAQSVIDANPHIRKWAIGGHSLGAAMAASFTLENPDSVQALFFYGFYPNEATDISSLTLPVLNVYGTLDGLATVDEVFAEPDFYATSTQFVAIEGGNHAQFGDYGTQEGDLAATISAETQQDQAASATVQFLDTVFAFTDPVELTSE